MRQISRYCWTWPSRAEAVCFVEKGFGRAPVSRVSGGCGVGSPMMLTFGALMLTSMIKI